MKPLPMKAQLWIPLKTTFQFLKPVLIWNQQTFSIQTTSQTQTLTIANTTLVVKHLTQKEHPDQPKEQKKTPYLSLLSAPLVTKSDLSYHLFIIPILWGMVKTLKKEDLQLSYQKTPMKIPLPNQENKTNLAH